MTSRGREASGPWAVRGSELLEELEVDRESGLSAGEVRVRRKRHGANALRETRPRGALRILVDQLASLIVGLLAAASLASFVFGDWMDGVAILVVILLNTAIGFLTELRAVRTMSALRELGSVTTRVRRESLVQEVAATDLVPGDIVVLEGGDVVTADLRLLAASRVEADESALTGESAPVAKTVDPAAPEAPLAERPSMLFKGTALTGGSAEAVVVATGMETEIGSIARLVEDAHDETTPLEVDLARLGRRLVVATLLIAAATCGAGILGGGEPLVMIQTSIALAVAAIPEGLPIVATMALARGLLRMARRGALVNRLAAVETLGATDLIVTDKTGTLTENRMAVRSIQVEGAVVEPEGRALEASALDERLREALEVAVLCNNAELGEDGGGTGDPMERALLAAGRLAGLERAALQDAAPRVREEAFDARTLMMATVHDENGRLRVAVKGAVEAVAGACTRIRGEDGDRTFSEELSREWQERARALGEEGLRVIALAGRTIEEIGDPVYRDLAFLGLVALQDPPRPDVRSALEDCRAAGIRVVMATGDQAPTALSIARAVGLVPEGPIRVVSGRELAADGGRNPELLDAPVFARVSPEQKLELVGLQQSRGRVVAMTGDGVNDAPALKKADIGVAMGRRGTQVAKEAADMVLTDDRFATIVEAVRQGRIIAANIRKFVVYLMSCNVSEILVVAIATALGGPLPLLPLQILFLNLVTDVFPALALAFGEGDRKVLERPPRRKGEPILSSRAWWTIGASGLAIASSVLLAFELARGLLGLSNEEAVTVSFLALALAQLWQVFAVREPGPRLGRDDVSRNPWVWGALALCFGLLGLSLHLPALAEPLGLVAPGAAAIGLAFGASLLPALGAQAYLGLRGRGHREDSRPRASAAR